MPAFNAASTIAEAIRSVLAQTFTDWELVVVDDGSTDATAEIVRSFTTDERVRLVTQANAGVASARNTANAHCRGAFICRFDADDLLLPDYLTVFDEFIRANPGYDIYASNAWRVAPDGSRRLYHQASRFGHVLSLDVEDMLRESQIFTAAVSPRSIYERFGGYRPGVLVEEYDYWLRAMAKGARHRYTPQPLVLYRERPGQLTADVIRIHESQIRVLRDAIGDGLLSPEQERIAKHSIRLLEMNVVFRRAAARVLGPDGAKRAVAIARKMAWLLRPYRWMKR